LIYRGDGHAGRRSSIDGLDAATALRSLIAYLPQNKLFILPIYLLFIIFILLES
jgi:hypothetical protein